MICERIGVSAATGAYMETYFLSPSDQIQIGRRHPVVVICPGGAYLRTSDQEAEQVALHFNTLGYHAAVLRYSCQEKAKLPNPMLELAEAVRLLRENAEKWLIQSEQIVICGFSAGGHLCAWYSNRYAYLAEKMGVSAESLRPNAVILGYPKIDMFRRGTSVPIDNFLIGTPDPEHPEDSVIPLYRCALVREGDAWMMNFDFCMENMLFDTDGDLDAQRRFYSPHLHVTKDTPQTFVWTTCNDDLLPVENSLCYVNALVQNGVPCEFHMFADGHHGLSLADDTVADNESMINPEVAKWFELCAAWLRKNWSR